MTVKEYVLPCLPSVTHQCRLESSPTRTRPTRSENYHAIESATSVFDVSQSSLIPTAANSALIDSCRRKGKLEDYIPTFILNLYRSHWSFHVGGPMISWLCRQMSRHDIVPRQKRNTHASQPAPLPHSPYFPTRAAGRTGMVGPNHPVGSRIKSGRRPARSTSTSLFSKYYSTDKKRLRVG